MSAFGIMTKRDLSVVGRIGYGLLLGIIISTLLNVFILRSQPVDFLIDRDRLCLYGDHRL